MGKKGVAIVTLVLVTIVLCTVVFVLVKNAKRGPQPARPEPQDSQLLLINAVFCDKSKPLNEQTIGDVMLCTPKAFELVS